MNSAVMCPYLGLSVPVSPSISTSEAYLYAPPDTTWNCVTPPLQTSADLLATPDQNSYSQPQLVVQLADLLQALPRLHSESSAEVDALCLHPTCQPDEGRRPRFHAPRCNGNKVSTWAIRLGRRQLGCECGFLGFLTLIATCCVS